MSGTLGTGYVAVTPVNLATVPRDLEGSKAGLLTLNWALVKAVNHTYIQPVNLLQLYQTGQFTTVQAVLIDNSLVGYPVRVSSLSTGQAVTCPAYAQVMAPLLVSVAANFTVALMAQGTALDQVATRLFFLNTPQTPYTVPGVGANAVASASFNQTVTQTMPACAAGASSQTSLTLIASYPPGTQLVSPGNLSVTVSNPAANTYYLNSSGVSVIVNLALTLTEGGNTVWQYAEAPWAAGGQPNTRTVINAFPASVTTADGNSFVLTAALSPRSDSPTPPYDFQAGQLLTLGVNFAYTLTTIPP